MKKRIISAIVMMIILIPILIIGGNLFELTMGIIGILSLKEFMDLKKSHSEYPDFMKIVAFINLLLIIFSEFDGYSIAFGLTYKGLALAFLCMFIPCLFYKDNHYTTKDACVLYGSIVFLGLLFNSLILIRNYDVWHLVYLVLIVVLTDTFALFIGQLIGSHRCSPKISPKKTWEGCVAGSVIATIIASIFYVNIIGEYPIWKLALITLILSIVGQFGDLVFSKIKRENNIKDFGTLIPGHGGVLDRIDSFTFCVLTFIMLFGII